MAATERQNQVDNWIALVPIFRRQPHVPLAMSLAQPREHVKRTTFPGGFAARQDRNVLPHRKRYSRSMASSIFRNTSHAFSQEIGSTPRLRAISQWSS